MLRNLGRPRRPTEAGADRAGVAALEAADLAAINHWLSMTRTRTVVLVLVGLPLMRLGGLELPMAGVAAVCLVTAALSPLYERWMARGGDLRLLVYVQLIVDTLAITAGLALLGPPGQLFRYFFLMTIVPATMVSGVCGGVLTLVASASCAVLLALTPVDAVRSATETNLFVIALFIFVAVANQCFFYKRHLRDKNREFALTGTRLTAANAELTVAAETALGLFEVARAVGSSLELGVVLERLHAVAVERLKTEWCATLLVDATRPAGYRLLASRGLGAPAPDAVSSTFWELGARLAAESVIEVSGTRAGPGARTLADWGVGSGLFTLMRYGSRPVGVFATGYRERTGSFAAFQRELAAGIATQAVVAIENATLHARQRDEAQVSAALLEVAELVNVTLDAESPLDHLSALVCKITGCDRATVLLCDGERGTFRVAAGHDPQAAHRLDEARTLEYDLGEFPLLERAGRLGWAEAWEGDGSGILESKWYRVFALRTASAVPLFLRGELIGFLTGGSRRHAGPCSPVVRRLFTGVAPHAVTALENSRLVHTLRAANSLKSEFISTMSHELRTPLNAIIGYNELLAEGEFGPITEQQRAVCAKVLTSSRQLLELIQATLDVSRMESGALPVTLVPVDVRRLLDEVAQELPAALVKPGVTLSVDTPPALPTIVSDHAKLKMIVRNLAHNALKFTDQGSVAIRARLDDDGAHLRIDVADTGIGIGREGQAIIFEMFRQVDGSDRRRHDGVGLGLYIVQRLAVLLGGTISVDSDVGRGATFHVALPLVRAASSRPPSAAGVDALSA